MWKPLHPGQLVHAGDQLRCADHYSEILRHANLFKVSKTDQHYFELIPLECEQLANEGYRDIKLIKYFDIGYNINLEVWVA